MVIDAIPDENGFIDEGRRFLVSARNRICALKLLFGYFLNKADKEEMESEEFEEYYDFEDQEGNRVFRLPIFPLAIAVRDSLRSGDDRLFDYCEDVKFEKENVFNPRNCFHMYHIQESLF